MTVYQGPYFSAHSCSGSADVTTQRMQAYILSRFPATTSGGIYNCRNIAGSTHLSVHATGRAADTMTGTGQPTLESKYLAEQMRLFSKELGIQGIIHNRRQWFCGKGTQWRDFGGSNPHVDHIHWERIPNTPLDSPQIVPLFQGPAPTGSQLFAGHIVSRSSSGTHVVYVQARLNAHGFNLKVDGICGPLTTGSIRRFQGLAGIKVDGIAGPVTQGRLQ